MGLVRPRGVLGRLGGSSGVGGVVILGAILASILVPFSVHFGASILVPFWARLGGTPGSIRGPFWELFCTKI